VAISVKKWRNQDPARTETFPIEHEALNRARELLDDCDHQAAAVSDSSGNVLSGFPPPTEVGILRKLGGRKSNEAGPKSVAGAAPQGPPPAELLDDPVVGLVMMSDGVDRQTLELLLETAGRTVSSGECAT
jgi:hypothetical protein